MTSRLDRLTARRFVTRHPDPTDGRLVRVRLSTLGRKRLDAAFTALVESERELLAALPAERHRELADALRALLVEADPQVG
jgi:DNA-binding MarR family transcriptional regulator